MFSWQLMGKHGMKAKTILEQIRPGSYLHMYWDTGKNIGSDEAFSPNRLKVGVDNGKVVLTWPIINYKGKRDQCHASWG